MTEDILQYIWKVQAIHPVELLSTMGEPIRVIDSGELNHDSGPDFSNARIVIDEVEWVGDVEIHMLSSSWNAHHHQNDTNYNRVVLHVVWRHDKEITREDGTVIPSIELQNLIDDKWLERYQLLMSAVQTIPCQQWLASIDHLQVLEAFNRALIDRLERKSAETRKLLESTNGDWEETTMKLLIRNMGFNKNKEAFEQLSERIDHKLLRRLNSLTQMEAYLFGMAGLIPTKSENRYIASLQHEYSWIQRKFDLGATSMSLEWWKFMRMRPANFPTQRIAQLSAMLFNRKTVFRLIVEGSLTEILDAEISDYWRSHYHFTKRSGRPIKGIGALAKQTLALNVVAPLLVTHGKYYDNTVFIEKAVTMMETLKPEENAIIRKWQELGVEVRNSAESQGAIELFNNYCKQGKCLSCSVGTKILNPSI